MIATALLVGAGCAQTTPKTVAEPDPIGLEQEVVVDTPTQPSDEGTLSTLNISTLLPEGEEWNPVSVRNFGNQFNLEIHPWWHWDATQTTLEEGGALFANTSALLHGGTPKGKKFRMRLGGSTTKLDTQTLQKESNLTACDLHDTNFSGWSVCIGKSSDGMTVGFAQKNMEDYHWTARLLAADPSEEGIGYFAHALASFTTQDSKE